MGGRQVLAQAAGVQDTKGKSCPELGPVKEGGKSGYIDQTGGLEARAPGGSGPLPPLPQPHNNFKEIKSLSIILHT
ncbi:MAG: hypothetical protein ACUVXF_01390 [Desulfobaccales bacterium]